MSKRFLLVLELPDSFTGDAVDAAKFIDLLNDDILQGVTYNCMEDALEDYILQQGAWGSNPSENPPFTGWIGHP